MSGRVQLHGYDQRPVAVHEHGNWSAERVAADLGVGLAVARRAVEQERTFTPPPPVSSLVVDGAPMLGEPAFWAAHLGGVSRQRELVAAAFGVTWDEARDAGLRLLRRPDSWPVFSVPLPAGGVIVVVHAAERFMTLGLGCVWVPDCESSVDFWLAPPVGDGLELARISGHPWGPGLRWPELRGIARAAAPDRMAVARRLLLLAPILGDVDAGEEAVAWFAQALSLVGGRLRRSSEARSAAEALVYGNELFTPAEWWCDDRVWMCNGVVSRRNPAGDYALPPAELRRVSEAVHA